MQMDAGGVKARRRLGSESRVLDFRRIVFWQERRLPSCFVSCALLAGLRARKSLHCQYFAVAARVALCLMSCEHMMNQDDLRAAFRCDAE